MAGLITPRNLPLAQLIMQQRQQERTQAAMQERVNTQSATKTGVESMKEQGRNERTVYNAEARAELRKADIDKAIEIAQLNNDTRVLGILKGFDAQMARLREKAAERGEKGEQFRAKLGQNDAVLKAFTQRYGSAVNAYSQLPSPETQKALEETDVMFKSWVESLYGVSVTPGTKKTVEEPGSIIPPQLPKTTTVKTPPTATVKSGAGAPGPTAQELIEKRKRRQSTQTGN